MAYINGNEVLFSPKVNITVDNANIEDIKKAILTKGGNIADNALMEDVAPAILDLPVGDTNYVEVVDSSAAFEKNILTGAEKYAMLNSIGGLSKFSKNAINPKIIKVVNRENTDVVIPHTINADGSIEFDLNSKNPLAMVNVTDLLPYAYYTHKCECEGGNGRLATFNGADAYDFVFWFEANNNDSGYLDTHIKAKLMACYAGEIREGYVWYGDGGEADEFEPYFAGFRNTEVSKIESIGADGEILLDTFEIPEFVINLSEYDYIQYINGKWQYVQGGKELVLTGTEDILYYESTKDRFYYIHNVDYGAKPQLFALYTEEFEKNTAYFAAKDILRLYEVSRYPTVEKFRAHLAYKYAIGNPTKILYKLATPKVTDITTLFTRDNLIEIEGGGYLRFKNDYEQEANSTITYIRSIE